MSDKPIVGVVAKKRLFALAAAKLGISSEDLGQIIHSVISGT